MKLSELKKNLENFHDDAEIYIYIARTGFERPLLIEDIDRKEGGNLVIDAEWRAEQ